jgi:hypothetical protein
MFSQWLLVIAAISIGMCPGSNGESSLTVSVNLHRSSLEQKDKTDYEGWEKYNPAEGGFHAFFPKKPVVKKASPATGNFHVIGVQRSALDELGFSCQWKMKDQPSSNKDAEVAYLLGQQTGMVLSAKGKLIEGKEISVDGVLGRDFIVKIDEANTFRCRAFVSGKLIGTLTVYGKDAETVRSGDAKKFLESFKMSK